MLTLQEQTNYARASLLRLLGSKYEPLAREYLRILIERAATGGGQ